MKTPVYNQEGKEVGQVELPKEIFEVALQQDALHQVVISQMANRRQTLAHTKDRREVSGGGKKPWRQKGTGRARAGSIRSPLWRGGGITFGPRKDKVFLQKINKKLRRKALFMALSEKARRSQIIILDELHAGSAKAKILTQTFKQLPLQKKTAKAMLVLPGMERNIIQSANNLPNVQTMQAKDLNALDVLSFHSLVMPKETIEVIKTTFVK
ncbi:MAG: 50S ribosomal protein L4 [Parcubacteria group bacterium]|nr:50S ribosomal protein L4 [Parcubacteria group bacterium]